MIAAETIVSNKNFMLKFSKKRIEAAPGTGSCEQGQRVSFVDEQNHSSFVNASNQSEMKKMHNSVSCPGGGKKLDPEYLKSKSSMPGSNKRGPQQMTECQREKRQKMDRSATSQCSTILKKLMSHPAGWVFNQPVDPVVLNIPDYFSVIKNPMDLGTIKSKLVKNMYFGTEEFEADIRLTFSNAMLYNPPDNSVHKMAVELNNIFETRWKAFEEKWNLESLKVGQGKLLNGRVKETNDTRQNVDKAPPSHNILLLKRSVPSVEKVTRSSDGRDVELAKTARNCTRKSTGKDFQKGVDSGSRHACGSVNAKVPLSSIARKCGRCGDITCQCILPCDSTHTSSSDLSSERSLGRDHRVCGVDASIQDCQAKSMSVSQMRKTGPDSDGGVCAFDDENACLTSQTTLSTTDSASQGGCPDFDVQLSPKKALRVAMLKSRYAETILKAQEKTLLDNGNKADPLKMQQEKERLERRQREERAKIEAQIRVAEAASRMKEELDLKQKREREREAARAAVHKVEKTVDLEENLWIQKELDMLLGCSLSHTRTLLEQLGLFIKVESMEDDYEVNLNVDGEEGEIFS
ncbi:transcription factor GTE12 isoform X1 [Corylus avellana]|uniref:transcription factor GTE12 isoform X1 n=1 Tax=Corylus avellana TaxID=13451 RepID=UPI001E1EDCDD|nr:transcription factor GTE12 isoform X1 [Corylus avellana]XP_059428991.1 transcription factor GTE12 isoform X1 [Corylus avellana]